MELVWFKGIKWVKASLKLDEECVVFGKPTIFNNKFNIAHPELEWASEQKDYVPSSALQAVYSTTELLKSRGLESKGFVKLMKSLISVCVNEIDEILSDEIISNLRLAND